MIAPSCSHTAVKRHGKDRYGNQRYRCLLCGKTWVKQQPKPLGVLRLPKAKAVLCLRLLLEGNSIRATERLTGISKHAILRLLAMVGRRANTYWATKMENLPAMDVECDEIWDFIGCKEKRRQAKQYSEEWGDVYTFTAIERTSKLILAFHVGRRTSTDTANFAERLRHAIDGRCQVSVDGFQPYETVIPAVFNGQVDLAQVIKAYGNPSGTAEVRYSPGAIVDIRRHCVCGFPDLTLVCTSHIERHNLSIRMGVRRMTRLTNAFSKKRENHEYALSIFFLYYNFCRPHMTLSKGKRKGERGTPTTPAMKAGITDEIWTVEKLLDELAAA